MVKKVKTQNEAQRLFRSVRMSAQKTKGQAERDSYLDSLPTPHNLFNPYPPTGNSPLTLPYPDGRFQCIEIDPPWNYNDKNWNGMADVQKYRVHPTYPVMPMHDIWAMGHEVRRISHPDGCLLWMWVTKDFEVQARAMMECWGFTFKQSIPWVKTTDGLRGDLQGLDEISPEHLEIALSVMKRWGQPGKPKFVMGRWIRNASETLLLATSNNSLRCANSANEAALILAPEDEYPIMAPSAGHSAKPSAAYALIKRNSPGPRLSIFQRTPRDGFECFGNQMPENPEAPVDIPRGGLVSPQGDPL